MKETKLKRNDLLKKEENLWQYNKLETPPNITSTFLSGDTQRPEQANFFIDENPNKKSFYNNSFFDKCKTNLYQK